MAGIARCSRHGELEGDWCPKCEASWVNAAKEGLESVRRCNDPDPNGDGMRLCDLWPDHKGPHVNVSADEGCLEWRNRG